MLDFICTGSVDLRGTRRSEKNANEKFCPQRDSNRNLRIRSGMLYQLSYWDFVEYTPFKVICMQKSYI